MSLLGGLTYGYSGKSHEGPTMTNDTIAHTQDESDLGALGPPIDTDADLQQLARQLSRNNADHSNQGYSITDGLEKGQTGKSAKSEFSTIGTNPFEYEKGSVLDPNSPNFQARAWTKALYNMMKEDSDRNPGRRAGLAYRNLTVTGEAAGSTYQPSVGNVAIGFFDSLAGLLGFRKKNKFNILQDFEGVVEAGEMLVVLGPPGSGCSTFLKTIAGETHGFDVAEGSALNYQGISSKDMTTRYKGEAIYTAEVDVHFPNMTVGDTLYFSARARMSRNIPAGMNRKQYAEVLRDTAMATFGISHTINTQVGNDFIRGVSGGERKRVTIAEAASGGAAIQCWDNSTRGLDSANAIEFCKTLRLSASYFDATALVAIYQAPQSAYDIFDKVLVIYEGRQIYFGRTTAAKQYFVDLGFECPARQTTADFLTSMTSAQERLYRSGFENKAPRSPQEFAAAWQASSTREALLRDVERFNIEHPIGGPSLAAFAASRKAQQAKGQSARSPYTLSYGQQIKLCLWRGFKRLIGDPSLTITQIFGNTAMGLIVSSVFFNLPSTTDSFFSFGALLFFSVLLNAFGSALEILTLYAQRPIVEKQSRYAYYHPSAEAFASMLTDMPYKIMNAIVFNITIYFMTNLRREPGPFFFFFFVSFLLTLTMSMLFRTIASVSRTLSQAMTPAALLILAIVMYTGFAIPTRYMHGWSRWINYLDPVAYGFESLMINQFSGRTFDCSNLVPNYGNLADGTQICSTVGSVAGQSTVSGDAFLADSYQYYHVHKWRNVGILFVFMFGLGAVYLAAAEWIGAKKSKGEVLLFRRGHVTSPATKNYGSDIENFTAGSRPLSKSPPSSASDSTNGVPTNIAKQTAVFHWENVCYDIKIKKEARRILDNVDGWVRPGTLTALMGVSGAGKTTLLDVLATRVTMGVVSGSMLVDGRPCDESFQRRTGYVQQQDLHLQTTTVREALNFSALLRQPANVPKAEKLEYVNEVIALLDMQEYADAVVGVPGEGLNVEQRKRLTIGVELAAKPDLLLFLDEPTSGLDSQTSWAICDLMEKLTKAGQAILCTVHQPSAMLFQRFDRLLFLAKGGRTIYFGEVGHNSHVLTSYFERNGSHKCPPAANPAEWMLEVIGAAPGSHSEIDWHATWKESPEFQEVKNQLAQFASELPKTTTPSTSEASKRAFAAPFGVQFVQVTKRVFEQYWRTPSYIFAKASLCLFSSLFIGFTFYKESNTQQGLQNQLFAIFMLFTIFGQIVQQIMPHFVTQRALYEARERPSKTYSWISFMLSNIVVELPWNGLMALIIFFCLYYPIGLQRNAIQAGQEHERGGLFFLFVLQFMLFTSTFTDMVIAGIGDAETGGNIANLMFSLCLIFCGVLATPTQFPHFWIFLYRVSPFTYLVDGLLSTGVANAAATCDTTEYLNFNPPAGQSCLEYMQSYINSTGGFLLDDAATTACQYCQVSETNTFLDGVSVNYTRRWRNFGILWAFIIINIFGAILFYWLARVPKKAKKEKTTSLPSATDSTQNAEMKMHGDQGTV